MKEFGTIDYLCEQRGVYQKIILLLRMSQEQWMM
jgi:hypothetical protein